MQKIIKYLCRKCRIFFGPFLMILFFGVTLLFSRLCENTNDFRTHLHTGGLIFLLLFFLGSCEHWPSIKRQNHGTAGKCHFRQHFWFWNFNQIYFLNSEFHFWILPILFVAAFVVDSGDFNATSGSRSSSCTPLFSLHYHQQNRRVQ